MWLPTFPRIAAALRRLHAGPPFAGRLDMFALQRRYLALAHDAGMRMPSGYDALAPIVARAEAALAAYPEPLVPCHNDLLAANFLDDGQDVRIIDYEYSGLNELAFELATSPRNRGWRMPPSSSSSRTTTHAPMPGCSLGLGPGGRSPDTAGPWGVIQHAVSGIDADFWGWAMHKYDTAAALLQDPATDTLTVAAAAPTQSPPRLA